MLTEVLRTRQYLTESLGQEAAAKAIAGGVTQGEKISRSTLEEEAREGTLKGHGTPEERFWQRQRGQAETIAIGKAYIAKVRPRSTVKSGSAREETLDANQAR